MNNEKHGKDAMVWRVYIVEWMHWDIQVIRVFVRYGETAIPFLDYI